MTDNYLCAFINISVLLLLFFVEYRIACDFFVSLSLSVYSFIIICWETSLLLDFVFFFSVHIIIICFICYFLAIEDRAYSVYYLDLINK